MSFKIDMNSQPDPIELKFDGGSFTLHHTWMDCAERSLVMQVLGESGINAAVIPLLKKVKSWGGVEGPDGLPMSLRVDEDSANGVPKNLLTLFGRIPFVCVLLWAMKMLAANGVRLTRFRETFSPFVKSPDEVEEIARELSLFWSAPKTAAGAS